MAPSSPVACATAPAMSIWYCSAPAPWVAAISRGLVTRARASALNASGLPARSVISPRTAGSAMLVMACRSEAAARSPACTVCTTPA